MSAFVYSVCAVLCALIAGLKCLTDYVKDKENEKVAKVQQMAVEP
jgi:hypothetical protein